MLHPRGYGVACAIGIELDVPTIGVAKKLLYVDGLAKRDVKSAVATSEDGEVELVGDTGRCWGAALIACPGTANPIYVSSGHRISLKSAVQLVRHCARFRVPEPVRQADLISREWLRQNISG